MEPFGGQDIQMPYLGQFIISYKKITVESIVEYVQIIYLDNTPIIIRTIQRGVS